MSLLSTSLILFLIMDSIGQIASVQGLLEGHPHPRRVIIREMLIALAFMVLFNYIGEALFDILNISETTVRLSSGVILFLAAIKILFPPAQPPVIALPEGEPFIVPLAIPMISGPALLATLMLFAYIPETTPSGMMIAILVAWSASAVILLASGPLKQTLGVSGLTACERLMAMVLIMLAIQRFMEGVQLLAIGHDAA